MYKAINKENKKLNQNFLSDNQILSIIESMFSVQNKKNDVYW